MVDDCVMPVSDVGKCLGYLMFSKVALVPYLLCLLCS
jgi:hypothetical protein